MTGTQSEPNQPRLLITGAGGFTGRYVQELALQAGFHCIALLQPAAHGLPRRREDAAIMPGVDAVYVDLTDCDELQRVLQQTQPDYVIHLAAIAFVAHRNTAEIYQTNVIGTVNLLDSLTEYCPAVKRIVLASSGNIYGNADMLPIRENHPARPLNDYAVSKHAMECAAHIRSNTLPIVVVRPFNYTGAGQSENFLLAKIVAAYRRSETRIKLGNLHVARDFSDVRDVAGVYLRLLNLEGPGGIYNICSGRSVPLLQIIDIMDSLAGYSMQVDVDPALVRPNEITELYGSDAQLQARIGTWRQYELENTLHWMLTAPAA